MEPTLRAGIEQAVVPPHGGYHQEDCGGASEPGTFQQFLLPIAREMCKRRR